MSRHTDAGSSHRAASLSNAALARDPPVPASGTPRSGARVLEAASVENNGNGHGLPSHQGKSLHNTQSKRITRSLVISIPIPNGHFLAMTEGPSRAPASQVFTVNNGTEDFDTDHPLAASVDSGGNSGTTPTLRADRIAISRVFEYGSTALKDRLKL